MRARACHDLESGSNTVCPGNSTEVAECNEEECTGTSFINNSKLFRYLVKAQFLSDPNLSLGPFLETKLIRPLRVKMCKLPLMISWEVIFVVYAGNNQKQRCNNWRPLHLQTKGSHPEGKMQFF